MNIPGNTMSQPLPIDELETFETSLAKTVKTPDDNDVKCFLEVHTKYLDMIKQKSIFFTDTSN